MIRDLRFKRQPLTLALAATLGLVGCHGERHAPAVTESPVVSEPSARAASAAAELGSRLKARLVETMQQAGPVAAIEVCNIEAPQIAGQVSASAGLDVGRTSLQLRNPANAPSARERAVLERWAAEVDGGTPVSELGVHVADDEPFLWMKPIVVEGPCLVCHGRELSAPLAAAIAERYPQDQATGFDAGDLRGAFVVRAADSGR